LTRADAAQTISTLTIVEITGGMLRAARSPTGLSQQEFAERASISRPCLTAWEGSSGSVRNAKARALHRVVSALEAEGARFSDGGDPRRRDGRRSSHSSSGSENLIFSFDFRLKIHGGCL